MPLSPKFWCFFFRGFAPASLLWCVTSVDLVKIPILVDVLRVFIPGICSYCMFENFPDTRYDFFLRRKDDYSSRLIHFHLYLSVCQGPDQSSRQKMRSLISKKCWSREHARDFPWRPKTRAQDFLLFPWFRRWKRLPPLMGLAILSHYFYPPGFIHSEIGESNQK